MKNSLHTLLGEYCRVYQEILENIIPQIKPFTYEFVEEKAFREILKSEPSEGMKIYWSEILYRAHYISIIALLRTSKWVEGLEISYNGNNYFSFCANLRGFLESCTDSYDCFRVLPKTLACNFDFIKLAIRGEQKQFAVSDELEDRLIHFSHGRRVEKNDNFPQSHRALKNADYLLPLEKGRDRKYTILYKELCEITHPAASTVSYFFHPLDEKGNRIGLQLGEDELYIFSIVEKHKIAISELFEIFFNPALITLKILNLFDCAKLKSDFVENIKMDNIKLWNDVLKLIKF